ncbi:MAG: nucleotidyl transferase AbiEii/AbiGii toxin family protein, partial [Dehalococcoidia bacterium]
VAVRYHVSAELDGRRFDDVIIDVGFGDPFVGDPDVLEGPDLLTFAGISPIAVPAIPLDLHVAEKVHAYTRTHSEQRPSSRVKDLVDIVLIRSLVAFDADRLRRALDAVFDGRGTHTLPTRLPPPPSDWGPAYRDMAREVGLDSDVLTGYGLAAAFLDPILNGMVPSGARWDPARGSW